MATKITEDLVLNYIEENRMNDENTKVLTWELSFYFCGKHYTAYLDNDSLDKDSLRYPMTEGPGVLLESFEELLESEEVEKIIREKAIEANNDWKETWLDDESEEN
jgi:hypothetical protein